jgi:hypothetical protein
MISEQVKKRDRSFYLAAIIVGLFGAAIFIGEYFFPSPDSDRVIIYVFVGIILITIENIFYFKGSYHWSKAKGYPGSYCLFALFGPLGLFILYRLNDLTSE